MNTYIESMKDDMQGMGMIGTTSTGPGIGKKMQRNAALLLLAAGIALSVAPAHAEVHLPNGEYRTSHTDLRVKVLGGYVTVERTWQAIDVNKGKYRWYFNPAWADLDVELEGGTEEIKSIGRTGAKFEKQSDDLFVLKEADHAYFIRVKRDESGHRNGLRWTDRRGNAIDYDVNGKIVSYNDRNGIMVHFGRDGDGHITEVRDHNHPLPEPALLTWTWADEKVTSITDYSGRSVQYHYTGDNLTEVIDVLQHPWGYSYVGAAAAALMHTETDAEGRVTTIDYNGNRVWKVTGPVAGATTVYEYTYDRGSRQYTAVETSPEGKHTESTYDADGKLIRQELGTGSNIRVVSRTIKDSATVDIEYDERNLPTRTEYDANRNPIKVTYPDGSTTSATYDGAHSLPLTRTDQLGVVTKYEYDPKGNLTKWTEASGQPEQRVTTFTYDTSGQRLTQTVEGETPADDATMTWSYDEYGNVLSIEDPEGNSTSYEHDVQGNVVKYTDAREKEWFTPTNAAGWTISRKDPLGHEEIFTYDKIGNRTAVEDPEHKVTRYTYTPSNQLETVEDPMHGIERTRYAKDRQKLERTDAMGAKSSYTYDQYRRLSSFADAAGNVTMYSYGTDCRGQPVSGLAGLLTATKYPTYCEEYKYDVRGNRNVVTRVLPSADESQVRREISTFRFDAKGRMVSHVDPLQRTNSFAYDYLARPKSTVDAVGGVTTYEYDVRNNLTKEIDANGSVYTFEYDKLRQLKAEKKPLTQVVSYTYDKNGNVTSRNSPNGNRRLYEYDDSNRLIQEKQFPPNEETPSQTVSYVYNDRDLLQGYVQTGDTITSAIYGYDDNGRKIDEAVTYGSSPNAFTRAIHFAYESNGLLKKLVYPDGIEQSNTYDKNRLKTVGVGSFAIQYDNYVWHEPTKVTMPGVIRTATYDPLQRPTEIKSVAIGGGTADSPGGPVIMDHSYTYNPVGSVTQRMTEDGAYLYGYDDLNRLTNVQPPVGLQQNAGNPVGLPVEQYTYDAVGNRRASSHQPGEWIYNKNNELLSRGVGENRRTYEYDLNGNMRLEKVGDPEASSTSRSFFYGAAERLREIRNNNTDVVKYRYDPTGRRISKETAAGVTWFQYANEGLVAEYSSDGTMLKMFGWIPRSLWGTGPIWRAETAGGAWQFSFYHNDNKDTPQYLSSPDGQILSRVLRESFGRPNQTTSTSRMEIGFPGQYYDDETGYSYNYFRDYDPETGRYLETDPIGLEGGISNFGYADQNPVNRVDPTGLQLAECQPGEPSPVCYCRLRPAQCEGLEPPPEPGPKPAPAPPEPGPRPALPDPFLDPPPPEPQKKEKCTCATKYPEMDTCPELAMRGFEYDTRSFAQDYFGPGTRVGNEERGDPGKCTNPDKHWNVYIVGMPKADGHIGSIVSCKCCRDTGGGPDPDFIKYKPVERHR